MGQQSSKKSKKIGKHVPQRTCIGCRAIAGKRGLVRVVRTAAGVVVDPTGKLAGRGAYIHPTRACWETVLEGNRINQALRTPLHPENRAALRRYVETLPAEEPIDDRAQAQ